MSTINPITKAGYSYPYHSEYDIAEDIHATYKRLRATVDIGESATIRRILDALLIREKEKAEEDVLTAQNHLALINNKHAKMRDDLKVSDVANMRPDRINGLTANPFTNVPRDGGIYQHIPYSIESSGSMVEPKLPPDAQAPPVAEPDHLGLRPSVLGRVNASSKESPEPVDRTMMAFNLSPTRHYSESSPTSLSTRPLASFSNNFLALFNAIASQKHIDPVWTTSSSGPPYKPTFETKVKVGNIVGTGKASNKQAAKQIAARDALVKLKWWSE